jgi:hypothetical protein
MGVQDYIVVGGQPEADAETLEVVAIPDKLDLLRNTQRKKPLLQQ